MKLSTRIRGFTLVELMVVVAIIGLLAALAIPNFIRFQAKSKQAEVRTNLKAIFQGQTSYFAEYDRYSVLSGDIGFNPERGNRYAYDFGSVAVPATTGAAFACGGVQTRTATTTTVSGGSGECGVGADIYRYGSAIVPSGFANRSSAAFQVTAVGVPALTTDGVGVNIPSCPNCNFAVRAWGNIDNDTGADEFFVSSQFTVVAGTPCAEAIASGTPGSPVQVRNDVQCE